MTGFVPVVRGVDAKFRKPAFGRVSARSSATQEATDFWISQLLSRGRCSVSIPVEVVDSNNTVVLSATIDWFISREKVDT